MGLLGGQRDQARRGAEAARCQLERACCSQGNNAPRLDTPLPPPLLAAHASALAAAASLSASAASRRAVPGS
jgi:hypothetical protein